jgi:hypothetical protein
MRPQYSIQLIDGAILATAGQGTMMGDNCFGLSPTRIVQGGQGVGLGNGHVVRARWLGVD